MLVRRHPYIDTPPSMYDPYINQRTHRGRCQGPTSDILVNIGSCNGLTPVTRQALTDTNAGLLLTEPWATHFNEISFEIQEFLCNKMHLKCRLRNGGHFVEISVCSPGD